MSNNSTSGGCGGCLITILVILVFLAAFGFVDWSTVGRFAKVLIYIAIAGISIGIIMFTWGIFSKRD